MKLFEFFEYIDQEPVSKSPSADKIAQTAASYGKDDMDYNDLMKAAELLRAGKLQELGKFVYDLDTDPRELIMSIIQDNEPHTFKKMYGDQDGYMSLMKPMGMEEDDMSTGTRPVGKKGKTRRATGIDDNPYDHNEGEDHPALVNAALWNMKDIYQTIMAGEALSEDDMFSYGDLVQYLEQADMPDHYSKFWDLVTDAINSAGGFGGQGSELQVDKNIAPQIKTLYQQFKAATAKIKGVKEAYQLDNADKQVLAKLEKEYEGYKSMWTNAKDLDDKKMYQERLRDLFSMIRQVKGEMKYGIDTALQDELSDMYDELPVSKKSPKEIDNGWNFRISDVKDTPMPSLMRNYYQPHITQALRKAAGFPESAYVYFDDADLVYGSKTVWPMCGVDDKCTFGDAVKALKKFAKSNPSEGESHFKEELGADKEAQIKAWANKYKKYEADNGDPLPAGFLENHLNTGVPTDSIEAGEVKKYADKYGDDALGDLSMEQVHDNPDEFPITNAFLKDLEKIFGYIPHGDEVEEIADVLRYYDGPKGIKEDDVDAVYPGTGEIYGYTWNCKKCGTENEFSMSRKDAQEYIDEWEADNEDLVADGETGSAALTDTLSQGEDSGFHYGNKCVKCGAEAKDPYQESINDILRLSGLK